MEIQNVETREYIENNTQNIQMVRRLVDAGTVLEREIVEILMGLWGRLFLDPHVKNFLFRYTQARLFTNQTVAQYIENQDRGCTFCTIKNRFEGIRGVAIADETVGHLFWECNHVMEIINWVCNKLVGRMISRSEFMIGNNWSNTVTTGFIIICYHWTKYWIYTCKQVKRMPILREFKTDWEVLKNSLLGKLRFCRILLPVRNL